MKKSQVYTHPFGSAEFVLAHAKWRASRNRRPSMPFNGERNPEKALEMATVDFIDEDEIKILTAEEFVEKYDHDEIKQALRNFSFFHAKKLPKFLIHDDSHGVIMLDILKVFGMDFYLPVVVRSTNWLKIINKASGQMLDISLHEESWSCQDRFQLVGGLSEIFEKDIEGALSSYLQTSISYWKSINEPNGISVSERVKEIAKSEKLIQLINEVDVVELSNDYKQQELYFFKFE